MESFINSVAKSLGISDSVAKSATTHVLNFLKDKLPGGDFSQLLRKLPGAESLVGGDVKKDTGGGMFGGLAQAASNLVGGEAGEGIELIGKLKESGLNADQLSGFGGKLIEFVRDKAGDDMVEKILSAVPALKKFA